MIILDKRATAAIAKVIAAARIMLKGGEHEGRCVHDDDTTCRIHADMLQRRQERLREAIAAWDALND